MTTIRTITQAATIITQTAHNHTRLTQAITNNLNAQPQATDPNPTNRATTNWCWTHEQTTTTCHRNGHLCDGEHITTNDPTGETAITNDPAANDLRQLRRLEQQAINLAHQLDHLRARYLPHPHELPTPAALARHATPGHPGCHYCETHGAGYNPACTDNPTTVAGNLPTPHYVCRSHYDYIRTIGRPPRPDETKTWHRRGRWPRQAA